MFNRRKFVIAAAAGVAGLHSGRLGHAAAAADSSGLVSLTGTAAEAGKRLGALNAADIRAHLADILGGWRKRGLSENEMISRSTPFRRFAEKFGPHWLDEAAACAAAAEVPFDHYVAYLAGKYRALFFVDECTSLAASGTATADGAPIFHKNRDNMGRAQSAYYKRITDAQGAAGFFATGDTSDLGLMMMVNDRGLAGSADTGGLPETRPKGRGVMNPYILRLIAEQAGRCEEALEIIQEMIADGWYAGGSSTGTHWLFADRFGTILRVAQNAVEEQHWFHRDDVVFLARGTTPAAQTMLAAKGKLSVRHFHEAVRSPDICFGSSISALTVRIDPRTAIADGTVWIALPAWSPFLPLHAAAEAVPAPMVDGTSFCAGHRWLKLRQGSGPAEFAKRLVFGEEFLAARREFQDRLYDENVEIETRLQKLTGPAEREQAADLAAQASLAAWRRYDVWCKSIAPG